MAEARNLRNMTIAQTPLLGDENTPLHPSGGGTGFESATPQHQVAFTPNPLATPVPGSHTDLRTPMRDNLKINPATGLPIVGNTPREQRLHVDSAKRALKASFMNLPRPENNFELLVPEDEEEEEVKQGPEIEEDAAERDARLKRQREEEERRALARQSQPVQLGLPRPARVNVEQLMRDLDIGEDEEPTPARRLINAEMASLMYHDSVAHPLPGTNVPGGSVSPYVMPSDEAMALAKSMVHSELATLIGFPSASEEQVKEGLKTLSQSDEVDERVSWAHERQRLAFDPNERKWVDPEQLTPETRVAGYTALLDELREQMTREASRTAKMEKKLGIVLGGYQARANMLAGRLTGAFEELVSAQWQYTSFERLAAGEGAAGPRRVEVLREEVDVLERRERLLQERHAELDRARRDADERVAELEEKLMVEAEALNEAALAEMESGA